MKSRTFVSFFDWIARRFQHNSETEEIKWWFSKTRKIVSFSRIKCNLRLPRRETLRLVQLRIHKDLCFQGKTEEKRWFFFLSVSREETEKKMSETAGCSGGREGGGGGRLCFWVCVLILLHLPHLSPSFIGARFIVLWTTCPQRRVVPWH